jgi:hypothetical protein
VSTSSLTYRQVTQNSFRVSADGVSIGSISRHTRAGRPVVWHWGVDTMPLMAPGRRPPFGDADSFEAAQEAFKSAFTAWHATLDPSLWENNRSRIAASALRWRR